jgi:hypothetical protein
MIPISLTSLMWLTVPTLLAIGRLNRTVFGRRFAPPEVVKPLGNFPALGRDARQRTPGAKLVEFEGVCHVPHPDIPERFHAAVLEILADKRRSADPEGQGPRRYSTACLSQTRSTAGRRTPVTARNRRSEPCKRSRC